MIQKFIEQMPQFIWMLMREKVFFSTLILDLFNTVIFMVHNKV